MKNFLKKIFSIEKVKSRKRTSFITLTQIKKKYILRLLFFKITIKVKDKNTFATPEHRSGMILKMPVNNPPTCSYGAINIDILNKNTTIGRFCSFGQNVVLGNGEHPLNFLSTSPYFYFKMFGYKKPSMTSHEEFWDLEPIHIGNDVWIGDEVYVKNGVTIGDGAVIGTKSLVTKDVPPYAIVVGCPARILRYRFDEQTIKDLLETKWWDLPDEIIKQIPYDNIDEALKFIKKVREDEKSGVTL